MTEQNISLDDIKAELILELERAVNGSSQTN